MIKAEIILDTRRSTKKGFPVKIRIYDTLEKKHLYFNLKIYQENETLKSTNIIKQREYELTKELEFINSKKLNIHEAFKVIENGVPLNDIERKIVELEAELSKLRAQLNPIMLFEFSEIYLNEKRSRKELVRLHVSVLNKFKEFISPLKDIPINDLRTDFLISFQISLSKTMKPESVNSYIEKFQSVFNEAQRREELNIKQNNPFKNIRKLIVNNDNDKSISVDSLQKLINCNFDDWSRVRAWNYKMTVDLFLFQIVIGGHDFVDISLLKWTDVSNSRIKFKRNKNRKLNNGGALINNRLFDFALNVIEKYGTKDNERIFSFIPLPNYEDDNAAYKIYQHNYNRRLKYVQEKLNIPEIIISKRSRYTFNTIAGNLLINRDIIEEIQGHTQSSISHGYYGGTLNEIKDREHKKIIDYIFKKPFN